jgi:CBS domain-containing protein
VRAGDLARRPPVVAGLNASVRDVARLMAQNAVGLVVIADEMQRVVGVVSERDVVRAVASGLDLSSPASKIMSSPAVTVDAEEPVWRVAQLMRERGVRHVVVTRAGSLYGVISIRDLIAERSALLKLVELSQL